MENKNIVILKRHPREVHYTNPFYLNQCSDLNDRVIIDLTSRNSDSDFSSQISPFFVGPVTGPDRAKAKTLEIFWQIGKVFPHHDDNGKPNQAYFKYRNELYKKDISELGKTEMRHPYKAFGYKADDMLYWPYYDKNKKGYIPLSYLEARKKVYIPEYAKLVVNSSVLERIKKLLEEGKKVALLDFDGFNYYSEDAMKIRYRAYINKCKKEKKPIELEEKDFTDIKNMKSAIDFPYMPVGHAFIIKALLQGDIEVKSDEVIDHINCLK